MKKSVLFFFAFWALNLVASASLAATSPIEVSRKSFQVAYRDFTKNLECTDGTCGDGVCLSMAQNLLSELKKKAIKTDFDAEKHCEFTGKVINHQKALVAKDLKKYNKAVAIIVQVLTAKNTATSEMNGLIEEKLTPLSENPPAPTPTPIPTTKATTVQNPAKPVRQASRYVFESVFYENIRQLSCVKDDCPDDVQTTAINTLVNELRKNKLEVENEPTIHSYGDWQKQIDLKKVLKPDHLTYLKTIIAETVAFYKTLKKNDDEQEKFTENLAPLYERHYRTIVEKRIAIPKNLQLASFLTQYKKLAGQTTKNLNLLLEVVFRDSDYKNKIDELRQSTDRGCPKSPASSPNYDCLSDDERQAIRNYTGNGYSSLNNSLRANDLSLDQQETVKNLTSGLKKLRPHRGLVFRGAGPVEHFKKFIVGTTMRDKAFLSTSLKPGTATGFASSVLLILITKTCPYLDELSASGGEREVLCAPNTGFKVVHRVEVDSTVYILGEEL